MARKNAVKKRSIDRLCEHFEPCFDAARFERLSCAAGLGQGCPRGARTGCTASVGL